MTSSSTPTTTEKHIGLHVSNHPVLGHKLTIMRRKDTSTKDFRDILREITFYLGYETTSHLEVRPAEVQTPLGTAEGVHLGQRVALIPIMRAGLAMVEPMLTLLPHAVVHHIGMYRDKRTLCPILYYNKLPPQPNCDVAIILEPMIATAGTLNATVDIVKDWGVKNIIITSIVASKPGLRSLLEAHPDVRVHVAAVDEHLSDSGLIVPGLGDVGNRFFSTWDDEPSPMEGHAPGAAGLEVPADADTGAAGKKRRLDA